MSDANDLLVVAPGPRPHGMPPLRQRNRHPEDTLHAQVWKDLKWVLPPEVAAWSHENRNHGALEGQRRRARGVVPGVPDMQFAWPVGRSAFVELKADKGRLSDEQRLFHARLEGAGLPVAVCRSFDEVLRFLRDQGCPLRCRVL